MNQHHGGPINSAAAVSALRLWLTHQFCCCICCICCAAVGIEAVWQPKRISESSSSSYIGYNQAFEQVGGGAVMMMACAHV
jgi:hypothetical protein